MTSKRCAPGFPGKLFLVCCITCGALGSHAQVAGDSLQTSLAASRLSGPAPLAVNFDATGTTSSNEWVDAFSDLGYFFYFDDPAAGSWSTSELSKNIEIGGPLSAHFFERPGTNTGVAGPNSVKRTSALGAGHWPQTPPAPPAPPKALLPDGTLDLN